MTWSSKRATNQFGGSCRHWGTLGSYPDTTILWSELLPGLHCRGAVQPSRLNYAIVKTDRATHNMALRISGRVIRHPDIKPDKLEVFIPDGIHLTPQGNELWLREVKQGFEEWLADIGLMVSAGGSLGSETAISRSQGAVLRLRRNSLIHHVK